MSAAMEHAAVRLTEPQRRALLWLEPGKIQEADRSVSAAAASLALYHGSLATAQWYQTPRGRGYLGYRLTGKGVSERARLLSEPPA